MFSFFATVIGAAWIAQHWQIIVLVLAALIALIVFYRRSKKKAAAQYAQAIRQQEEKRRQVAAAQEEPPAVASSSPSSLKPPASIGDATCVYQYEDVALVPSSPFCAGQYFGVPLSFSVSDGQIVVSADSAVIGFVKPGKLTKMISDWLDRGDPVWASLSSVDEESHAAAFNLCFYRDEFHYLLNRQPDAKQYKLTGNRSGELQENASMCSVGSECSVSYDYEKEKYEVSDGWTIGYLPAPAARIIEESTDDSVRVFISDVETDEEGKAVVFVYVFH